MEVACSLDDVARVLADSGYNFSDDACFPGAPDLPSMLSALDSPDSFPESPCSDEDIARVLDITRMPSPSLLGSCAQDTFTSHIPSPSNNNEPYCSGVNKTRDPCITNAVLQNSLLNVVPGFSSRDSQSLDLFSMALNCSFTDDTPQFNTLVNAKENEFLNNNTYFNSSLALSPVSETDSTLPISAENFAKCSQHIAHHNNFTTHLDNNLHQAAFDISSNNESIIVETANNIELNPIEPQVATSQSKRKRRRKNCQNTPKSKKKKLDKSNSSPKPKTNNKSSTLKNTTLNQRQKDFSFNQTNIPGQTVKHQTSQGSKKSKTKNGKNNISFVAEVQTSDTDKQIITSDVITSKDNDNSVAPGPDVGSTNDSVEESKGLRRSSRSTRNTENYNFRLSSLVKRVETERKQQEPRQPKGKAKPPPLSKYRRRTANARERDRMKEINEAYEKLKDTLPEMEPEDSKQKVTKFTILKLALNYIASLQDMLDDDSLPPGTTGEIRGLEDIKQPADSICAASSSNVSHNDYNDSWSDANQQLTDDNGFYHYPNTSCAGDDIVFETDNLSEQDVIL